MKVNAPGKFLLLGLVICFGFTMTAQADEADAKRILKSMSDYVGAQSALSFEYDASLGIVTADDQVLDLVSTGSVVINRPDKIRAKRSLGFADIEAVFDGETFTLLGKTYNVYTQIKIPGSIDHLIEELKTSYH
ncbi:MAG: DUF2092 domain-containing protein, partial [Lysobacterales bacterium]